MDTNRPDAGRRTVARPAFALAWLLLAACVVALTQPSVAADPPRRPVPSGDAPSPAAGKKRAVPPRDDERPAKIPAIPAKWTPAAVAALYPDPDKGATDDDFAGSLECRDCHQDRFDSLTTSFHKDVRVQQKDGHRGCESCHGPGFEHYADGGESPIRHPNKAPVTVSNGACVACHAEVLTKPIDGHRAWVLGPAARNRHARCVDCHRIHVDKSAPEHAPAKERPTLASLARTAQNVPTETCRGCHPTFHPEMARSGHANLLTEGERCATCHGNGSLHVASGGRREFIVNPERLSVTELNRSCDRCHEKGEAVQRWTCAEHAREDVSCLQCHDTNGARGKTLVQPEFQLCGSCHQDVAASFRLPNRHRVAEGRMTCSECHDPHGNRSRVKDKDLKLRTCAKCHQEKQGPFLFDHGIKRSDGCIACHVPHGTSNRRLLTHTRTRDLCLQCHPETPHDLTQRRYDNCIACHSEIHGSDLDRIYRR